MSEGDDRFMKLITAMAAMGQAAGGGAESQIHTQEQISVTTRFKLQVLHGAGLFLAFVGFVGGLFLFTLGLDWLFRFGWEPRFYLLAWTLAALAVLALSWGVERVLGRLGTEVVTVVQAFIVLALLLFFGLAAGALALTTRERFGWQLLAMVVGAGLMLACPAFGYNQLMDLLNPYWRRSPYEQAVTGYLLPPLSRFLDAMDGGAASGEVREEDPSWLLRSPSNGQEQYGIVARPVAIQDPSTEDWADYEGEETERVRIRPRLGNLIWFVRYAAKLPDLTIDTLTAKPKPMLPFEEEGKDGKPRHRRLSPNMIRRLIARGSTSDEVRVDGLTERGMGAGGFWRWRGQGATAEWVVERDEAQRRAEQMWRSVYKDSLPVPDYWRDRDVELAA